MQEKQTYKVLGLMSGTSLDGLDIAYCEFYKDDFWSFKIKYSKTIDYSKEWKCRLENCMSLSQSKLSKLDLDLGTLWGQQVSKFIIERELIVDFIASHGHTVFHQPKKGITVQIGDANEISNQTKLDVISDFRTLDVQLGGQGAPLVPIGDKLLFAEYDYCLNLGGISNASFDDNIGERKALDISPCNLILNHYANKLGFEYDENGNRAKRGQIHQELLSDLNQIEYYAKPFPKSLGKEDVIRDFLNVIENYSISVEDKMRTFTEHIACQIGTVLEKGKTLVTGGGAYNTFLIDLITKNSKSKIILGDDILISFKEALIFAYLGVLRIRGELNILKSYTGAKENSCSGVITNYNSNS